MTHATRALACYTLAVVLWAAGITVAWASVRGGRGRLVGGLL